MISVVVPAYNAAATLGRALETLRAQTYTEWEALVIDDGSTDATASVLATFRANDRRFRGLTHAGRQNQGTAVSRNLGVQEARGAAVAFLDADDDLFPDALAGYVEALERYPAAGVIYGQAESFGDGERRVIGRGVPGELWGMLRQLTRFNVMVTSATLARRDVLGPEPFPTGLPYQFEDWACWLELSRRWPFVFLPRVVARYQVSAQGFTARMERAGESPNHQVAQGRELRRVLAGGDVRERHALSEGLTLRSAMALLEALAALRHGQWGPTWRWTAAALAISGPARFPSALAQAVAERRRISRRADPLLTLDPPPPSPRRTRETG